ncbi:aconitate hydratase [Coemansia sp. RSA 1365]|nr:aconitate hydratase [Coemansia sp. RSA 1365]
MSSQDSTPRKRQWDDGESNRDDVLTSELPAGSDLVSAATEGSSAQHNHLVIDASEQSVSTDIGDGNAIHGSTLANAQSPTDRHKEGHEETLEGEYHKDVSINHSDNRQILAQSATHRIVMEATAVQITTRGRYYSNSADATPADPELHLHVEATTQESLDKAVEMLERIKIEGLPGRPVSDQTRPGSFYGAPSTGNRHRGGRSGSDISNRLQYKIFVDVESERGFNVRAKLIGTGGENMKYIQNTTGAQIQVRGRGSGYSENYSISEDNEPMHLLVMSDSEEIQTQALAYGRSLVDTIRAQHKYFQENGSRRRDRHPQRNGRDRYDHRYQRYGSRSEQDNQFYAKSHEQQYSAPHYTHPAPYPRLDEGNSRMPQTGNTAQAYDEYANYYAQYYQYYGTYPDHSTYYSQANTIPAQQAQSSQHSFQGNGSASTDSMPNNDGYHNVPPPASYSNGH